jgi:hypothetical protein
MHTSLFTSLAASSAVTQGFGRLSNAATEQNNRVSARRRIATHIPGKHPLTPTYTKKKNERKLCAHSPDYEL